jgi:hypothetical protein
MPPLLLIIIRSVSRSSIVDYAHRRQAVISHRERRRKALKTHARSQSSWNSRRHQLFTLWAYSEKGEYNRDYTITCPPRPSTSPLLCIRQNNIYRAPPSGAERECCDARRVIFHGKKEWHSAPLIN